MYYEYYSMYEWNMNNKTIKLFKLFSNTLMCSNEDEMDNLLPVDAVKYYSVDKEGR